MIDIRPAFLPMHLHGHVLWFAAAHGALGLPAIAAGSCGEMSYIFQEHAKNVLNIDLEIGCADDALHCTVIPQYDAHTFLVYEDTWVIDFTARQFWHDCAYPMIARVDQYACRFTKLYLDDGEGHAEDLVQRFHKRVEILPGLIV